jgi:DNA-binding XRE family transcriptional regulator
MISGMDDKEIVGFTLRLLRENAGLNQEQLGRKVRRTVQAVYRHETGKKAPSLDEITAYLRVTGCRFSEFEILVNALGRFRQRLASGPGWHLAGTTEGTIDATEQREHERLAEELGNAAGRLAREVFQAIDRARRL